MTISTFFSALKDEYPIHQTSFIQHLQVLGLSLIAVSILYLIASNWFMLPHFIQLAIPPLFLLLSSIASVYVDNNDRLRQTFQTIASVMVGLSLAVIGQIYQTGADSYQLFLVWAILLLPWLYRPNIGVFTLFCVVSLFAIALFFEQTFWLIEHEILFLITLNVWTMLLFAFSLKFYPAIRWVLLLWIAYLSIASMVFFLIRPDWHLTILASSLCLPLLGIAYFQYKKQSLIASLAMLILGIDITMLMIYGIVQTGGNSIIGVLFICAIIIFAWFAVLAMLLKKMFPHSQFNVIPLSIGAWISGFLFALTLLVAWEEASLFFAVIALVIAIIFLRKSDNIFARQFFYCLLFCGQTAFLAHLFIFVESPLAVLILQLVIFLILSQCRLHWFVMALQLLTLYGIAVFNLTDFNTPYYFNQNVAVLWTLLNFAFYSLIFVIPSIEKNYRCSVFLALFVIFVSTMLFFPSSATFMSNMNSLSQPNIPIDFILACIWSLAALILIIRPQSNLYVQIGFAVFASILIACQFFEILALFIILTWCLKEQDKLMYALNLISIVAFLWLLYYSLDISFLMKSASILISGLAVLALTYLLKKQDVKIGETV